MTADHIEDFFHASPFQPFDLFLADGQSLPVGSVECMTLGNDERALFIFLPGSNETELIDLALVVSVRFSEGLATGARRSQP